MKIILDKTNLPKKLNQEAISNLEIVLASFFAQELTTHSNVTLTVRFVPSSERAPGFKTVKKELIIASDTEITIKDLTFEILFGAYCAKLESKLVPVEENFDRAEDFAKAIINGILETNILLETLVASHLKDFDTLLNADNNWFDNSVMWFITLGSWTNMAEPWLRTIKKSSTKK